LAARDQSDREYRDARPLEHAKSSIPPRGRSAPPLWTMRQGLNSGCPLRTRLSPSNDLLGTDEKVRLQPLALAVVLTNAGRRSRLRRRVSAASDSEPRAEQREALRERAVPVGTPRWAISGRKGARMTPLTLAVVLTNAGRRSRLRRRVAAAGDSEPRAEQREALRERAVAAVRPCGDRGTAESSKGDSLN